MDRDAVNADHPREAAIREVAQLIRDVLPVGRRKYASLPLEMTMAQLRCVTVLEQEEPLAVGELGERLGIGLSSASRMVDHLVQDDLAERWEDPTNRRRALVRLSSHGRAVVAGMQEDREARHDRLRRLLARMSDDDVEHLRRGLRALSAAAQEP